MKGHKDKDGIFHPHTQYKGIRKSRDQSLKTQGVRLARTQRLIGGEKEGYAYSYQEGKELKKEIQKEIERIIRIKPAGISDIEISEINRYSIDGHLFLKGGMIAGDIQNLKDSGINIGSIQPAGTDVVLSFYLDRSKFR